MILSDGTCIPSYLGVTPRGSSSGSTDILNDHVLRLGEVKKVIWPDDPQSYGKRTVEYEIEVQYRDGNSTYNTATYRGCTVSTLFGGTADRFHATLRPSTDSDIGSKVLVLCLSGDQQKAIILGGVEAPQGTPESKEDGHNLYFEFNGFRFQVDKEGQATATFRGATQTKGELADSATPEAEGTHIAFDKDGGVKVATKDDAQYVKIDHKNKRLEILADAEWQVTVNDKATIQVQNDIAVESSAGQIDIGAAKNVNVKSAGVLVGDATDAWVKGTTYRNAQAQLHNQMMSLVSALAGQIATAGSALTAATALNAIPVVGGLLASPGFGSASTALVSAAPTISALAALLQSFEAQSATFLSVKNKTD